MVDRLARLLFFAGIAAALVLGGVYLGWFRLPPVPYLEASVDAVRDWRKHWKSYLGVEPTKFIRPAPTTGSGVTLLTDAASGAAPKLAPIAFEPNTTTPTAQGRSVLAALAKTLQDQAKLRVQVCGRTTLQDREAALQKEALPDVSDPIYPTSVADLRAGLGQLAQTRTTVIRQALDAEFGIRRGRVLECRSYYDHEDNGTPRVEIRF